jgi:V-type H+-transporting ATPase subunit e
MGASILPIILFTAIFGVIGGVLPIFVPKNPHRSVIQVILLLIGICCWLFWFCCYMSQMNPLIGPILNQRTLIAVKQYWGDDGQPHDWKT